MSFSRSIQILVAGVLCHGNFATAGDYLKELEARAFRGDREAQATLAHVYKKTGRKDTSPQVKRRGNRSEITYEERYEPTRPTSLGADRVNREAPNRRSVATSADGRPARGRYEPQRPEGNQAHYARGSEPSRRDQWESTRRDYDRLESLQQRYDRVESYDRSYREVKDKKKKGSLGKKILLSPFKLGFGLSKKAVKKVSFGWLPLM